MEVEKIRERMLGSISDEYDKSTGSFFYDPIAAVAIELAGAYKIQDEILKNAFASTAKGEYLERRCGEMGVYRKKGSRARGTVTVKGEKGAVIKKGTVFSTELLMFTALEQVIVDEKGSATVEVACESFGSIGNVAKNTITKFPMTLLGINEVTNEKAFTNGYDAEDDASLYERYKTKVSMPATSGNKEHYKQWAESVEGVGKARIFPLAEGAGTVKVVICDSNKKAADALLIERTAKYIDENRPIGAAVTVKSATEKSITISADIVLKNIENLETVKREFQKKVLQYFAETAFSYDYISYAKIGSLLYDTPEIADYRNLKINSDIVNVELGAEEIPILGEVAIKIAD